MTTVSNEVLAERVHNLAATTSASLTRHAGQIQKLAADVHDLKMAQAKFIGMAIGAGAVVGLTTTLLNILVQQLMK